MITDTDDEIEDDVTKRTRNSQRETKLNHKPKVQGSNHFWRCRKCIFRSDLQGENLVEFFCLCSIPLHCNKISVYIKTLKNNNNSSLWKKQRTDRCHERWLWIRSKWFKSYTTIVNRIRIKDIPTNIWNANETVCQNIHKDDSVVGGVSKTSYNNTALESVDRVGTSTALVITNAVGNAPSPIIIHKE